MIVQWAENYVGELKTMLAEMLINLLNRTQICAPSIFSSNAK